MKVLINLTEKEQKLFLDLKEQIEAERELKPTDLQCIALLANNLSLYEYTNDLLREEGIIIHTATGIKTSPALSARDQALKTIKHCMDSLLMTPRSKAAAKDAAMKDDRVEDDPLMAALKARRERGM